MTEEQKGILDRDDYSGISSTPAGSQVSNRAKISEEPIIVKLVSPPAWGGASYYPVKYHKYFSDPACSIKSERKFLCNTHFGKKCIACERYFELYKKSQDLKKAGHDEKTSIELGSILKEMSVFKRDNAKSYILVVKAGEPTVKALEIGFKLTQQLFGTYDRTGKKTEEGLVDKLKKIGRSPFDLKNPLGWLKIWKKGQKTETVYFVEEVREKFTEMRNGEEIEIFRPLKFEMNPAIFKLQLADLPDVLTVGGKNSIWTDEEIATYVASAGTERPERVLYRPTAESAATPENTGDKSELPNWMNLDPNAAPSEIPTEDDSIPFDPDPPKAQENAKVTTTTEKAPVRVINTTAKKAAQPAAAKQAKSVDPLDDLVS